MYMEVSQVQMGFEPEESLFYHIFLAINGKSFLRIGNVIAKN
jgi:hypothetical protein